MDVLAPVEKLLDEAMCVPVEGHEDFSLFSEAREAVRLLLDVARMTQAEWPTDPDVRALAAFSRQLEADRA